MTESGPCLSVIIPVLNEALTLPRALASLEQKALAGMVEVITVDGGSEDGTRDILESTPWLNMMECSPGRAGQMNAGAAVAHGKALLFLHADTILENGWFEEATSALSQPDFTFGVYRFRMDDPRPAARIIEAGVFLRNHLLRLPYGDQGLLIRQALFHQLGGFADMPLMEDVEIIDRARRYGRLTLMRRAAVSSSRRWQQDGFFRRSIRNLRTLARYRLGTDPRRLAESYAGNRASLVLLAKYPDAGRVKTRLGQTIGMEAACEVHRELTESTWAAMTGCAAFQALWIAMDPPDRRNAYRSWFGPGPRLVPQAEGDLGMRMQALMRDLMDRGFGRVVLIGSDCPGLNADRLNRAAGELRKHDLVLGPTEDGGYYLIGVNRIHPELFRGISWSTDRVLQQTLARARGLGLRIRLLPRLMDVDDEAGLRRWRERTASGTT